MKQIIGAAFQVSNSLGCGFLEKVYENALSLELKALGLVVQQHYPLQVRYKKTVVGEFITDLLVNDSVIIEIKAQKSLDLVSAQAQCLNYLKATGLQVCLLLNFGSPRVEVKRVVLEF